MPTEFTKSDVHIHLSVIIPAFNEEQRIAATVGAVNSYLDRLPYESEIVVVDDGSFDGTKDIIRAFMGAFPRINLIEGVCNRGKGWAVRQGMMKARGAFRVFVDADNSVGIDEWPKCELLMQAGAHVVVGSRTANEAAILVPQPPLRRFLGAVFRKLVRTLFELPVGDTQVGFKAFSAQAANEIFSRVETERWVFDVEVLMIARLIGYPILEVPVRWTNNPQTRMSALQMVRAAFDLVELGCRMTVYGQRQRPSAADELLVGSAAGTHCNLACRTQGRLPIVRSRSTR
jgi:glycosyltransferase involved in cell wall biosynthesis